MPTYYLFGRNSDPGRWIGTRQGTNQPRVDWYYWRKGSFLPKTEKIPDPVLFTLKPMSPYASDHSPYMPSFLGAAIPLFSDELVEALQKCGVDNLEVYNCEISDPDNGYVYKSYKAVNIIGLVAAADMGKSNATIHNGPPIIDVDFDGLVIDEEEANNHLFFGLAESTNGIMVHEKVRDLSLLPSGVRHWLRRSGVVGKPRVSVVKLRQRGRLQTEPGASWMDFQATQWISTKTPGFVWFADVTAYPGAFLYGRDKYQAGRGAMTISLLSLVPVVDATGPKVDQASLLRFLGEMALYPSAAVEPYVRWEEAGENAARATMTYGGVTATGVFQFDDVGNVLSFEARRYRESELEDWLVEAKDADGRDVEKRGYVARWDVSWRLDAGDWTWLELEIYDVTYDGERLR
ncbi:MAG: hypothetical protein GY811_03835 [Myxococcales bacterium]|nr:hypothetical protein [Myxococcales bacterium]